MDSSHDDLVSEVSRLRSRIADLERQLEEETDQYSFGRREFKSVIRSIIETTPDAIFMKDVAGRYTIVNSATADMMGYAVDQILGRTDAEIFPDDTADTMIEHDSQVIDTEKAHVYEEIVPVNGIRRTFLVSKTICRDDHRRVIGTVGIARDITERKRAERALAEAHGDLERQVAEQTQEIRTANRLLREDLEKLQKLDRELRESHERFRVIAEAIPVPVTITRLEDDTIVFANARARETVDSEGELIGRKSIEFYENPDDHEELLELLNRDGFVRDHELRVRQADGSTGYVSVSLQPIKFDGTEAVLSAALNITARKHAEESLRGERRLLKRLLDLHERDRQLTAYEIHDGMVQDMTAAVMFLESYAAKVDAPASDGHTNLKKSTQLVQQSINEARRLINGLRPPILEDSGLIAALDSLLHELDATAGLVVEFQHEVQFDRIAPTLEMTIYRIIQESLNNVWHHSGSLKARVCLIQEGVDLKICVSDEGAGFDVEMLDTRRYGLRGIRERARLLGGSSNISSKIGQGTQIEVMLPLADVHLPITAHVDSEV